MDASVGIGEQSVEEQDKYHVLSMDSADDGTTSTPPQEPQDPQDPQASVDSARQPSYQSGWYADPLRRFDYRYHDGFDWTADVAHAGMRTIDPIPGSATVGGNGWTQPGWGPAAAMQPGAAQFAPAAPRQPGRGSAIAAMIVGLGSLLLSWTPFIFALAAIGAVAAIVLGITSLRRRVGRGMAVTGLISGAVALPLCIVGFLVTREVLDYVDPAEHSTTVDACTNTDGLIVASGTITNLDTEASSFTLTITIRIAGETERKYVRITALAAGATTEWETRTTSSEPSRLPQCFVDQVLGPEPFGVDMGT